MIRKLQSICGCVLIFGMALTAPSTAIAANDGVWIASSASETGYFMITQVSNGDYALLEFGLNSADPYYIAYYGAPSRLNLVLDSYPDACPEYYVVEFTSDQTGIMTLFPREDVAGVCSNSHYGVPFGITKF